VYYRQITKARPDAGNRGYLQSLNPDSLKLVTEHVGASLAGTQPDQKFQFERHGYFVADRVDQKADTPVFNLAVVMKDSWAE
jgi:glutaminyl-tRNA synthetase